MDADRILEDFRGSASAGQRAVFDEVIAALEMESRSGKRTFFLHATAGTGKTHVAKALIASELCHGREADVVASSGIAADLLPGGVTAHSKFGIPVPTTETSVSKIAVESDRAEIFRRRRLIIWDEVVMASFHCVDVVDRFLRDVLDADLPNGGRVTVYMGDTRQILPVVPRGGRADIMRAALPSANVWQHVKVVELTENMRVARAVRLDGDDGAAERQRRWADFLLKVGDGRVPLLVEDTDTRLQQQLPLIKVPAAMVVDDVKSLLEKTFGDLSSESMVDGDWVSTRAVLCPKLKDCIAINDLVLDELNGDDWHLLSTDRVLADENDSREPIPVEVLNRQVRSGIPPHDLRLRPGCAVMLMKNLDPGIGLTNGRRLQVVSATTRIVTCRMLGGRQHGRIVGIPRILNQSSEGGAGGLCFERRQFPLIPAFAMTINKAQGQTLSVVGLNLETPCFAHGQLFVALSRVGDPRNVFVRVKHVPALQGVLNGLGGMTVTPNHVWKEIFRKVQEKLAGSEIGGDSHADRSCETGRRSLHEEPFGQQRQRRPPEPDFFGQQRQRRRLDVDQGRARYEGPGPAGVRLRCSSWVAPAGPNGAETYSWLFVPLIWAALDLNMPMTMAEQLAGSRWSSWVTAIRADFASRGVTVNGGPGLGLQGLPIFSPAGYVDAGLQEMLLHPRAIGGGSDIAIGV